MMNATNCTDAFKDGQKIGVKRQMQQGVYKLREVQASWGRQLMAVSRIGQFIRGEVNEHALICCTARDKRIWLQALPLRVAFDVGASVFPTAAALGGDGVKPGIVRVIETNLHRSWPRLLKQLDSTHAQLSGDVRIEYDEMRTHGSFSADCLEAASDWLLMNLTELPEDLLNRIFPLQPQEA
jgi:hypothetical protein